MKSEISWIWLSGFTTAVSWHKWSSSSVEPEKSIVVKRAETQERTTWHRLTQCELWKSSRKNWPSRRRGWVARRSVLDLTVTMYTTRGGLRRRLLSFCILALVLRRTSMLPRSCCRLPLGATATELCTATEREERCNLATTLEACTRSGA